MYNKYNILYNILNQSFTYHHNSHSYITKYMFQYEMYKCNNCSVVLYKVVIMSIICAGTSTL